MPRDRLKIERRETGPVGFNAIRRVCVLLGLVATSACSSGGSGSTARTTTVAPNSPLPTALAASPAIENDKQRNSPGVEEPEFGAPPAAYLMVEPNSGVVPGEVLLADVRCGPRTDGDYVNSDAEADGFQLLIRIPLGLDAEGEVGALAPFHEARSRQLEIVVPYWLESGTHKIRAQCGGGGTVSADIEVESRLETPPGVDFPWRVIDGPWIHPMPEKASWHGNTLTLQVDGAERHEFAARCHAGVDTAGAAFYLWTELPDQSHFVRKYPAQRFVDEPEATIMVADLEFPIADLPSPDGVPYWNDFFIIPHCTALETPFEPAVSPKSWLDAGESGGQTTLVLFPTLLYES